MYKIFLFILLFMASLSSYAQQRPTFGKIIHIPSFSSEFIERRPVDIWLPDGYDSTKKYAVLYMHDGQMLFDASTTWNKQAWEVDETLMPLILSADIQPCIVVGVWNGDAARHEEYFPQKPYETLTNEQKQKIFDQLRLSGQNRTDFRPKSDAYLSFLVKELKPYIDSNFSVFTDAAHTFLAGSSMGGLISMYGVCEYPSVFGGAACLSTHWIGTFTAENNPIPEVFLNYLEQNLPAPNHVCIYFDTGGQDLDALYPPTQHKVDELMRKKGFSAQNWQTHYFPEQGHIETAWQSRLYIPMRFLLGR
jgi:enterochelin esterase-like enzyme